MLIGSEFLGIAIRLNCMPAGSELALDRTISPILLVEIQLLTNELIVDNASPPSVSLDSRLADDNHLLALLKIVHTG